MTTNKHRMLITVEGGVIQSIDNIPANTVIEVRDFDRDGDREHPSWNEEHQAFVREWEGEQDDRLVSPSKLYRVKVISRTLEVYEIEAEDESGALESWAEGRLVNSDDNLENEILEVTAI